MTVFARGSDSLEFRPSDGTMRAMRRNRVFLLAVVGLVLMGWLTACGPSVTRTEQQDEKNPYFLKGKKKMYQERDYKEALKYYQLALDQDPNNAAVHLELGLLYEEKLQDYAYAIYHYRRYLELRPQTEKTELIKQFVDRCQLSICATMKNTTIDSGEEIARLRQESSNLVQQVEYLQKTNQELEQKVAKLGRMPEETVIEKVVTQVIYKTTSPGDGTQTPITQTNLPPKSTTTTSTVAPTHTTDSSKPKKYVVQPRDTLSSISQKVYGRRDKWQLIYSANKAVVGPPPSYKLRVGQTLTIPNL